MGTLSHFPNRGDRSSIAVIMSSTWPRPVRSGDRPQTWGPFLNPRLASTARHGRAWPKCYGATGAPRWRAVAPSGHVPRLDTDCTTARPRGDDVERPRPCRVVPDRPSANVTGAALRPWRAVPSPVALPHATAPVDRPCSCPGVLSIGRQSVYVATWRPSSTRRHTAPVLNATAPRGRHGARSARRASHGRHTGA